MPDYIPPPSTLLAGSTAWAYVRDSGGPTQDRSVGQQKAEIEAYCRRYGLNLTMVFADVAKSGGSTAGRDQFNEMIDMSKHEITRPNVLLIWNYARFARDLDDSQFYKSTLRKRGLVIHSLTDPIPEGPYGQVVEVIIDIANQEKKRQTSRDARRGLRELVELHGCVPGVPPTGFLRQPVELGTTYDGTPRVAHRWVPDPTMRPRIQRAFAMRAAGDSLATINADTRLFGSLNSYRTFFNNKIYIGTLEFGDLSIQNYCEAMIDPVTWTTVQNIADRFARHHNMNSGSADHPRRSASMHLLSGLVVCARCGSPCWAHVTKKKTRNDVECYRCIRRARRRDCDLPHLPAWSLEHGIINKLIEVLHEPEFYLNCYRALQRRQAQRQAELDQKRKEIQTDIVTLRRQMDNITNAIAIRGHSKPLLDRLDKLENEEAQLNAKLTKVKTALENPLINYTDQQLQAYAFHMADLLATGDQQMKIDIVHSLVAEIRMDRRGDQLIGEMIIYVDGPGDGGNLPPTPPDEAPPRSDQERKPVGMRKSSTTVGAPRFTHTIEVVVKIYRKPYSRE